MFINEIFVWPGGRQEATTCVNIEDNNTCIFRQLYYEAGFFGK